MEPRSVQRIWLPGEHNYLPFYQDSPHTSPPNGHALPTSEALPLSWLIADLWTAWGQSAGYIYWTRKKKNKCVVWCQGRLLLVNLDLLQGILSPSSCLRSNLNSNMHGHCIPTVNARREIGFMNSSLPGITSESGLWGWCASRAARSIYRMRASSGSIVGCSLNTESISGNAEVLVAFIDGKISHEGSALHVQHWFTELLLISAISAPFPIRFYKQTIYTSHFENFVFVWFFFAAGDMIII